MNKTIKRFHIYFTFNIFFINYLPYYLYNLYSNNKKEIFKNYFVENSLLKLSLLLLIL